MREEVFSSGEHKMRLLSTGGQGEVVLLLHGLCGNAEIWQQQFHLAEKSRLMAVDLLGHGKSTTSPGDRLIEENVDMLSRFIKNRELQDVTIVGHSLGGIIANSLMAEDLPVKKVVFLDAPSLHELETVDIYNSYESSILNADDPRAFVDQWFASFVPEGISEAQWQQTVGSTRNYPVEWMASVMAGLKQTERYEVPGIKKLVIEGGCVAEDSALSYRRIYPDAECHRVDDPTHFYFLTSPQTINSVLEGFIFS